ncbi:hypothetical protein ACLB1M_35135 [Escherichia coli]
MFVKEDSAIPWRVHHAENLAAKVSTHLPTHAFSTGCHFSIFMAAGHIRRVLVVTLCFAEFRAAIQLIHTGITLPVWLPDSLTLLLVK